MRWDSLQREVLEALGHSLYGLVREQTGAREETSAPVPNRPLGTDGLLAAMLRAADRDLSALDAVRAMVELPAAEVLRGDPQAKRALWPQLRALRRTRQQ